jgi:HSP20 family protein
MPMLLSDPFAPLVTQMTRNAGYMPPADVRVSDGDLVLTLDVPGLTSADLEIEFLDGMLFVRGERKRPEVPDGTTWTHSERGFGRFERRIKLPEGVDPDRVTAALSEGVLSLIVPKPERLTPRQIAIEARDDKQLETASA